MPLRLKIEPKIKVIFFSLSRAEEWRREIEEKRRCIADNELDFISVFFLCFIQGYPTKIDFGPGLFYKGTGFAYGYIISLLIEVFLHRIRLLIKTHFKKMIQVEI